MTQPNFSVEVKYGEFTLSISTEPLRTMSHFNLTDGRGNILVDRMISRDAAVQGLDFYLSGVEVFLQRAVTTALTQAGEKLSTPILPKSPTPPTPNIEISTTIYEGDKPKS